ncbi:hypothetical protein EYC84_003137 [Monilinia fructicola]|uniref:Uncharacterized protein n=1 Tax=Monilinia fructicola TaxID=38448 RepID=A0A5M9JV20_MONFR|nr:hypothetical protein EYC84_003137 [Monilinia fructicola]
MSSSVPIPFSEPPWLMGLPSPYYNASHRKWQKTCRALVSELLYDAAEWEKQGDVPADLYQKFALANFLIPNLPSPLPVEWLKRLGITHLPGDLPVEEFDYMHTLIFTTRWNDQGPWVLRAPSPRASPFGIPPILKFGSPALQERFLPDILTGKKRICIAISPSREPGATSAPSRPPRERATMGRNGSWMDPRNGSPTACGRIMPRWPYAPGVLVPGSFPPCRSAAQSPRCHDAPDKELESHWAWIEGYTWMMTQLSEEEANRELGGLTALAKAKAGMVLETCASTAVLLFGGNGYTKKWDGRGGGANLPRNPRRPHPRRKRRRNARSLHPPTSQELPGQSQGRK